MPQKPNNQEVFDAILALKKLGKLKTCRANGKTSATLTGPEFSYKTLPQYTLAEALIELHTVVLRDKEILKKMLEPEPSSSLLGD